MLPICHKILSKNKLTVHPKKFILFSLRGLFRVRSGYEYSVHKTAKFLSLNKISIYKMYQPFLMDTF